MNCRGDTKISVITCSLTYSKDLMATINSVRNQESVVVEHIIVLPRSQEALNLPGRSDLQVVFDDSLGVYGAMNLGLKVCTGKYVNFLNAGDVFESKLSLKLLVDSIGDKSLCYGQSRFQDSERSYVYNFFPYSKFLHKYSLKFIPHPSSLLLTESARELGGFNVDFRVSADQLLLMQLCAKQGPSWVPEVTSVFKLDGVSSKRTPRDVIGDFIKISQIVGVKNASYKTSKVVFVAVLLLRILRNLISIKG